MTGDSLHTFWLTRFHRYKVVEIADEDLFVLGEHLKELGYKD